MSKASPAALSLAYARELGYYAPVSSCVERMFSRNPPRKSDYLGWADYIWPYPGDATTPAHILAVQVTSGSNHATRVAKCRGPRAAGVAAWRAGGGQAEVWSWRRNARKEWVLRRTEL